MLTKKKEILLFIITCLYASLFIFNAVFGLTYENHCNDTATLKRTMEFTACEGTNCTDYNFTQYVLCEFGCDNVTHTCRTAQIYEYGFYFGGVIGIMILLGIAYKMWK